MHHQVRFCTIASKETTGGDDQALKPYDFILQETYQVDRWNSTVQHETSTSICLHKLTSNQTDFPTFLMSVGHRPDKIKYFTLITDSWYDIVSSFTPVNHTMIRIETTDSMSAFTCFSPAVILISLTFILLFYGLLVYSYRRKKTACRNSIRKNKSKFPGMIVVTMILKQYSAVAGTNRKKRLSFKLTIVSLVLLLASLQFMFTTFEKTELVIIDKPVILDSYQSIIDHGTTAPNWMSQENGYVSFGKAEKGSSRKKLWNFASKFCPTEYRDCQTDMNADNVMEYLRLLTDQKIVLIPSSYGARIIHAAMCVMSDMMGMNPVVLRRDETDYTFLLTLGYRMQMKEEDPFVVTYITDRIKKTIESGIIPMLLIPTKSPLNSMASPSSVRRCLNPDTGDHELPVILPKAWWDYSKLSTMCNVISVFAVVVHVFSVYIMRR